MKHYNIKACSLRWLGVELLEEYDAGTVLTAEPINADDYTVSDSNDGVTVRAKVNQTGATISLTVRGSSAVCGKLNAIRNIDRDGVPQIGPMVFHDPSGPGVGSGFVASNTFLLGRTAFTRGTDGAGSVTFRFRCETYVENDGGIAPLVVG